MRRRHGGDGLNTGQQRASTPKKGASDEILQILRTNCARAGSKFVVGESSDVKDAADFLYMTFSQCPSFGPEHTSAMARALRSTPAVFENLKDAKTSKGYTLSNAVQVGCLLPHLGVGCTAGDEESWTVFKDLYYPVIQDRHGYDANTQKHPTDLDVSKLVFSEDQQAKFNGYVVATRMHAVRNLAGFSFPCGATFEERGAVEKILSKALASIDDGDLKGVYHRLEDVEKLNLETRAALRTKSYLFDRPSSNSGIVCSGAARDWPKHRSVFHNDRHTVLVWCNEEDHCRLQSMKAGGDIGEVFGRLLKLYVAVEARGVKFAWDERLGFLSSCPSNLGTGLYASVTMDLKCFGGLLGEAGCASELGKELLMGVCAQFDLEVVGSGGEQLGEGGGRFEISTRRCLGVSEVEVVQKLIDGVATLIELAENAQSGSTPEWLRSLLSAATVKRTVQNLRTNCARAGSKFVVGESSDVKDAADFLYMTFSQCPSFGPEHTSAMARALRSTPAVFENLKDAKTSKGYTLSNAVQVGCLLPHLGVGCTAGDEESWTVFKDLYYPVIQDRHGYDANTQKHPTDLDASKLVFSEDQQAKFNGYVVATRMHAVRNLAGFSFPCGATFEERGAVEKILSKALASIDDGDLKGVYHRLEDVEKLNLETRAALRTKSYLFDRPSSNSGIVCSGAARDWPKHRSVFHNDRHTVLVWCNEEDHCRLQSMKAGGDIGEVFGRLLKLYVAVEARGVKFAWDERLGFLSSCPSNLGTGLYASVTMDLKCFGGLLGEAGCASELGKELLMGVCAQFDLEVVGSGGEQLGEGGGRFEISTHRCLGVSEVEVVQKLIDGVAKLIALEELLETGLTPTQVCTAAGIGIS